MTKKEKIFCCEKCKSTDLLFQAWVDEFNRYITSMDSSYIWCNKCDELTTIIEKNNKTKVA